MPGEASSNAIRQAARDLQLGEKYQARVRLTGSVPMADEEFATVQQGALVNGVGTVIVVLVILWLALKSARLIVAVFINLFVGLAITAALGLLMVGALNPISVAFAVLFVGLGVDFAIQFSVRYRAERHNVPELRGALAKCRGKSRRAVDARGRGGRRRIPVVPADRLPRRLRTRRDRRRRHADRLSHQHHAVAGADHRAQSAGRAGAGRLPGAGAGRPLSADLSRAGDRRNGRGRADRRAALVFPHLRLRSAAFAQPEGRVDFHLARSRRQSAGRLPFRQRRAAVARATRSPPPRGSKSCRRSRTRRRCRAWCRRIRTRSWR